MSERIDGREGASSGGLGWLRERLLPGGTASIMLAAYAMILAALVTFSLFQRDLSPARFAVGLAALAAIFVLHVLMMDIEARLGQRAGGVAHLALNGALWLVVVWASLGSANFSFAPFLLFMLVAQAVVVLSALGAASYSAALIIGWSALLWLDGFTPAAIGANLISLSTGLVFVVVFSAVLNLYRRQTERAEALLAELSAANAELQQARLRERELAVAEERVRLARDIHDGLGHHLTALSVQLQAAARLVERDPARAAAAIDASRGLARSALDEVRQSVAAMRRTPLDGRGLPEAIATLAGEFGLHAELAAHVEVEGAPAALPPAAAQTLFRAAQEGLTNARRHGGARAVTLSLRYTEAAVTLTVADDGTGASAASGGGFGLAGLRERAEQLGGSLEAGPTPGGFTLRLTLPIAQEVPA
jgi:signal transduction histidine kinase